MAKKKRVKKVSRKKNTRKRTVRRSSKKINKPKVMRVSKRKFDLSLRRLILFAVLAAISFILYLFLSNEIFKNLFSLLAMIFGFVAVGFVIVFLIFLVLKILKK